MKPTFKTPRQQLESEWWAEYCADPANQYYKINAQQLAKNPILLDCLEAPDGYCFVQLDYASLEDMVMAELSGCPVYREMYASGKPHDGYLFNSIKLLDDDGSINAVYNIDNPTPESVKAAKKQFKKERTIGKLFKLMSVYKAGAAKIRRSLMLAGVRITMEEARELRRKFWEDIYSAVLDYEECLKAEREQRDGWIVNAMGRPFAITDKKEKDLLNTMCQSTGHDCTDLLILYVEQLAHERGIPAVPVVPDYHDETIWMTETEYAEQLANIMSDAVAQVNDTIKFEVRLKGDPEITNNFTAFKQPDPVSWYTEKCNV